MEETLNYDEELVLTLKDENGNIKDQRIIKNGKEIINDNKE